MCLTNDSFSSQTWAISVPNRNSYVKSISWPPGPPRVRSTVCPYRSESCHFAPFFKRSAAFQDIVNKKYDKIFEFDELYVAISIVSTWIGGASIKAAAAAVSVV